MDWQAIFYFVGTIFMIVMLGFMIALGIFLYKIKEKLMLFSVMADRPVDTATQIGAGVAEGIALKIKEWTSKKAPN